MLDNGTVMNGKLIESPKSFQVACTVVTQIIAGGRLLAVRRAVGGHPPPRQIPAQEPREV